MRKAIWSCARMGDTKNEARKRWKALESNPEVMTDFARQLGLKEVSVEDEKPVC